jgi:hypothetical protein
MGKVESELSPAQIIEWSKNDLVITSLGRFHSGQSFVAGKFDTGIERAAIEIYGARASDRFQIACNFPVSITRHANDQQRRIGFISGVNDDGSFNLYILGSGVINTHPTHFVQTVGQIVIQNDLRMLPPATDYYFPEHPSDFLPYLFNETIRNGEMAYAYANDGPSISADQAFAYTPTWVEYDISGSSAVLSNCVYTQDTRHSVGEIQLTNNTENTMQLGKPMEGYFWQQSQSGYFYGDKNIGGDLFDLLASMSQSIASSVANMPTSAGFSTLETTGAGGTVNTPIVNTYQPWDGFMAYHYIPYNLILTYDLDAAKKYVEDGTLPSDAFIYPFDVDSIPINEDGGTGADSSDGTQDEDISGGDNSSGDDMDENLPEPPANTPQSLTNNNLYWLTKQQLKNFLDWFWEDATEIASVNDLWDKITGAYENLSQAIVAVRYMPVDPTWFGGVEVVNSMIVGLLEKEEQVQAINKTVAPVIDIGSTKPEELKKSFGRWINYSPYAQAYLYLPFFGYLDIDVDMVMNHVLSVKATYDIMSGTIQYFILRDGTMINTVCAKMATDIPISLQTKTERDSAIFSNVSGVAATLIGGGVSAAAGNPIGMVMSTANLASMQPQGAPMVLKGNVSEAGAFYDCGRCIIFIKRPAVNIPDGYASHIGYPCNAYKQLSGVTGFFKCENPYIEFLGAKPSGSDMYRPKPTAEEMDEIYNGLTEGLYMLDS